MPWNGCWTGWKIFSKRTAFPGCWCGNSSAIGLHCCCTSFSFPCNKDHHQETHFQWNHWELVTSSVVVLSKAARCRSQLPGRTCLPLCIWCALSREYGCGQCNRCGSEAAVCEMRFYACSLWNLFHHVVERSSAKRFAAKPDFVVFGIELLALAVSWSLKQSLCFSIWRWIEMAQVVLERFYWTSFRTRDGKYLRIRFIFSICETALVIFCGKKEPGWLLISS